MCFLTVFLNFVGCCAFPENFTVLEEEIHLQKIGSCLKNYSAKVSPMLL